MLRVVLALVAVFALGSTGNALPCSNCFVTVSSSQLTTGCKTCPLPEGGTNMCCTLQISTHYQNPPCTQPGVSADTVCIYKASATLVEERPATCDAVAGCVNQPSGTVTLTGPGCTEAQKNCVL